VQEAEVLQKSWLKVLALITTLAAAHSAFAVPIPSGALTGGFYTGANRVGSAVLNYDSLTGNMSYQAGGGSLHDHRFASSPYGDVNGLFSWSANVNRNGQLQGTGTASFMLDIGNGIELLASGQVVDFGFRNGTACFGGNALCLGNSPQVAIQTTFVDPRISAYLGDLWLWTGSMALSWSTGSPLLPSFQCNSPQPSSTSCYHFSGDSIIGYRSVSEPGALTMLALGLLVVGFAQRGRRLARGERTS
jgi:hypothetical protein